MASTRQLIKKYCKERDIKLINMVCIRSPEYIYGDYQGQCVEWEIDIEIEGRKCTVIGQSLDEIIEGLEYELEESEVK